jgi:hypothetical protein
MRMNAMNGAAGLFPAGTSFMAFMSIPGIPGISVCAPANLPPLSVSTLRDALNGTDMQRVDAVPRMETCRR